MRYTYHEGVQKQKKRRWPVILASVTLLMGVYILVTSLAPAIPDTTISSDATAKKLVATKPMVGGDRLYIPQINVDVAIVEINGNEAAALDKGAIHRSPASGNPKDGGNYVLAAHRFTMGLTPAETRKKSPFYHIDKVSVSDQLYVDYAGVRYAYKVVSKSIVPATAVEIEARTKDNQLTMYSCELSGARDGREVVIAEPIGTVAWQEDGTPKIEKL